MVTIRNMPKSKSKTIKSDSQLKKEAERKIRTSGLISIALAAVAVVCVLFGAMLIYLNTADVKIDSSSPGFLKKAVELNDRMFPKAQTVAAIVNGEEITFAELDERYSIIPAEYQQFISKQEVLVQMIDEKILLQAAEKLGINSTDEEAEELIAQLLSQNMITEEEFMQAIESRNMTREDVKEFYSREIILTKLINSTVNQKVIVSDTDIQDYYYRHPEEFLIPESINVSHILICHNESQRCVSNLSKEEAILRSDEIKSLLNSENFAEMAYNYSNEPAAAITRGNLGLVSRESPFDATFMEAAFNLSVGEVSEPIETVFGYHLITVFEKKNESMIELSTVYDQINLSLSEEKQQIILGEYLEMLKNESVIVDMTSETD